MTVTLALAFVFFLLGGGLGYRFGRLHRAADELPLFGFGTICTETVCSCPGSLGVRTGLVVRCGTCSGVR